MRGRWWVAIGAVAVVVAGTSMVVVRHSEAVERLAQQGAVAAVAASGSSRAAVSGRQVTVPELSTPMPVSTGAPTAPSTASTSAPVIHTSARTPARSSKPTTSTTIPATSPKPKLTPAAAPSKPRANSPSRTPTPSSTTSTGPTVVPFPRVPAQPTLPHPTDEQIQESLAAAVQTAADQGVQEQAVVASRTSGAVIASEGDDEGSVPAMSLVKLFIATDTIEQDGGVGTLSATDQQNLATMIETSDDGIAQDFYDAGGDDAVIERSIQRYGLTGSSPTPDEEYWGDVQITARDIATLLSKALDSPTTGPWLAAVMRAATDTADDGYDQNFGMNAIAGAGSKQGWGCCLADVLALHSAGFTTDRIVVILTTSAPDSSAGRLGTADDLMDDPGARTAREAITATVHAVLGLSS